MSRKAPWAEQERVSRRWLALSLAAFALIAAWLFGAATLIDRQATLEQGWTDAENTAALIAQHADRVLRIAEITTERVAELAERHGIEALGQDQQPLLTALASGTEEVDSLWVLDAAGRVVASSLGPAMRGVDLSDRAYFAALRDGYAATITEALQSRFGGWFFAWGRPLRDAEGRFTGAVMAGISGADFARLAEGLALGPGAALRLARPDGVTVMAWPAPGAETGGGPGGGPGSGAALGPFPGPAGQREVTGADGSIQLLVWRAAPSATVTAAAAVSRDHVLWPFHARLARNGLLFGLSALLAGLAARAALRAEARERRARREAEERGAALTHALAERDMLIASNQEGETRLRLAEQAGGIGLWDWDMQDGQLTLVGDVFSLWGLSRRRRLSSRAALLGVMPEDRPALAAALAAAMRQGRPLEAEFRLARASSEGPGPEAGIPERWIGVRADVRRGLDGQPRRLLGIALDVTARRQHEQALADANATLERRVAERTFMLADANARLREGEARFRGIFDATFQFIGLLSPDGTMLEANDAMLRLGGTGVTEVTGRPYWDAPWWPEDTRALVRDAIAEAAQGRFVRRELTMRGADGGTVAIDFSIKPVRDEDGIVSLLVPEARDVSALKEAQAQLLEAQKMETLGRLTGGVAHDFNNLLMAVLGNLALARKRLGAPSTPDAQRAIERNIEAATLGAERGAQLTQRLLAFARRQDLKPSAVDLATLLDGAQDLLRRSAGPLVELTITAPSGLPAAMVDPHALELALLNLVVNARDAMPDGGRIVITLGEGPAPTGSAVAADPGRMLSIAVADTGHGMDPVTLERAVEPFFTTKGPGQGTGLGLSMVHGLAHQSGGTLTIESAPGAGTIATLHLPVAAQPAVTAPRVALAEPRRGRGRVLVVDDEPLVLESTAAMIEDLGYAVQAVPSAEAALAALAAGPPPAVIITDHAMPGMTGAALASHLATLRPGLPVILATGHVSPLAGLTESLAAPGGVIPDGPPRLLKPYTQAQLAEALSNALARRAPE